MKYLRWFLLPFSLLYGLVVIIRNWFYDAGIFKSRSFDIPVISVGNLDVGGSGKTPMTEYLIRLLKDSYPVATLSRGYGRLTRGYLEVTPALSATDVGDEPAQLKYKFPEVSVNVCEDRVMGIDMLKDKYQPVILDDAYQHRAVKPGLSLLLFDCQKLNSVNFLLPAGNRRELFSGRQRANLLIVSKCPDNLNAAGQAELTKKLLPFAHQQVFFTGLEYERLKSAGTQTPADISLSDQTVFLLTGIASFSPLYQHIARQAKQVIHHKYPDHHRFTPKNIAKLADDFAACGADKKIIVTTEKDIQRLQEGAVLAITENLPVYILPVKVCFFNSDGEKFDQIITDYVRKHTTYRGLY